MFDIGEVIAIATGALFIGMGIGAGWQAITASQRRHGVRARDRVVRDRAIR